MSTSPRPEQKACVVIPAYGEERMIGKLIAQVLKYVAPVIVVDDGSPDRTAEEAAGAGAVVIRHQRNLGKGAALQTGFHYAREHHFDCLITLDADGQHDPADIPRFIETYERNNVSVLVGNRMGTRSNMPLIRKWTNRFMSSLLSRAMGQAVPDTQCGFRLYRCEVLPFGETQAARFAAESEILLYLAAHGIKIASVPIAVIYNNELSKINPFRDTFRFFLMLALFYWRRLRPPRK